MPDGFSQIQFKAGLLNFKNQPLLTRLETESATVEIQNASKEPELAGSVKNFLELPHLKMLAANYSGHAGYNESVIYDNTGGRKPHTLSYLKEKLGAKTASSPFPFETVSEYRPDFVIVVMPEIKSKIK